MPSLPPSHSDAKSSAQERLKFGEKLVRYMVKQAKEALTRSPSACLKRLKTVTNAADRAAEDACTQTQPRIQQAVVQRGVLQLARGPAEAEADKQQMRYGRHKVEKACGLEV